MTSPLNAEEIKILVKKAEKDKKVTVSVRKKGDPTVLTYEGLVVSVHEDYFRFHPEGVADAEATARVPDGKADTEYMEIKFRVHDHTKDIDLFSLGRPGLQSNTLGLVEYDPKTWLKVIRGTTKGNLPIVLTMTMNVLDAFFGLSQRPQGSHGTLAPPEEEKHKERDYLIAFLELASEQEITTGTMKCLWPTLLRLCALRRAQGTEGEKRKKILAKCYAIQNIPDLKKREEEWIKYNSQAAGSDPLNLN